MRAAYNDGYTACVLANSGSIKDSDGIRPIRAAYNDGDTAHIWRRIRGERC
jgi:hypothetical protein